MRCPECSGSLVSEQHGDVTVDRCADCNGVWFDPDEVTKYFQHLRPKPKTAPPNQADLGGVTRVSAGRCPRCQTDDLRIGLFRGMSYCRCRRCSGFFLTEEQISGVHREAGQSQSHHPTSAGQVVVESAIALPLDLALEAVLEALIGLLLPL